MARSAKPTTKPVLPTYDPGLPFRLDDHVGEIIFNKPVYDQAGILGQLDAGLEIATDKDNRIQFAFADAANATGFFAQWDEGAGYSTFNAAQREAAREAIRYWDDLVAPSFEEVNGTGGADIVFANTSTGPAQAWAYYPNGNGTPYFKHIASDVWIAVPGDGSNFNLWDGGYGLTTLVHEIGHTIGLSHPGNYDFGDDNDGDGEPDPITYLGDAFYAQDTRQYTIMSYFDSFETGQKQSFIDWALMRVVYASTPMVHDVLAIQAKYGADMTTRTGSTTYGFNATADVTNSAMRFEAGDPSAAIFTIWDASGTDTLDLSGYKTPSVIDLRPGSYSSAGGAVRQLTLAEINANNAAAGMPDRPASLYDVYFKGVEGVNGGLSWIEQTGATDFLMHDNIGIAYGTIIENAIGGSGNDRINGNSVNNRLTGGAGADTFIFTNDGSVDTITDFKSGVDKIDLSELGVSRKQVFITNGQVYVDVKGGADLYIKVEGDMVQTTDLVFG